MRIDQDRFSSRRRPKAAFAKETDANKRDGYRFEDEYKTPEEYATFKINMLRNDMCIKLSPDDINHLYSLKTTGDIDRATHTIIERAWSD